MEENEKKIIKAYSLYPQIPEEKAKQAGNIPSPGKTKREWMDDTPGKFAYKCLPLNIANQHGWDFPCPCDIEMFWSGQNALEAVHIRHMAPDGAKVARSAFGNGPVTFI